MSSFEICYIWSIRTMTRVFSIIIIIKNLAAIFRYTEVDSVQEVVYPLLFCLASYEAHRLFANLFHDSIFKFLKPLLEKQHFTHITFDNAKLHTLYLILICLSQLSLYLIY